MLFMKPLLLQLHVTRVRLIGIVSDMYNIRICIYIYIYDDADTYTCTSHASFTYHNNEATARRYAGGTVTGIIVGEVPLIGWCHSVSCVHRVMVLLFGPGPVAWLLYSMGCCKTVDPATAAPQHARAEGFGLSNRHIVNPATKLKGTGCHRSRHDTGCHIH